MRVASAHVGNEFDFVRGMLVGVMKRTSGAVTKGFNRAVEATFPAIDVLTVSFVLNGSFSNTEFVSILDKG